MSSGFTNKKPSLLGSDTHSAVLAGSIGVTIGNTDDQNGGAAGGAVGTGPGLVSSIGIITGELDSITVNITNSNSVVIFAVSGGKAESGDNNNYIIKEGTTQKASGTILMNVQGIYPASGMDTKTILGESSGNHTYIIEWTSSQLQTAQWSVNVININDTHGASLGGSNTKRTIEEGLIR